MKIWTPMGKTNYVKQRIAIVNLTKPSLYALNKKSTTHSNTSCECSTHDSPSGLYTIFNVGLFNLLRFFSFKIIVLENMS